MCDTFTPAETSAPKINAGKTVLDAPRKPNGHVRVFESANGKVERRFFCRRGQDYGCCIFTSDMTPMFLF